MGRGPCSSSRCTRLRGAPHPQLTWPGVAGYHKNVLDVGYVADWLVRAFSAKDAAMMNQVKAKSRRCAARVVLCLGAMAGLCFLSPTQSLAKPEPAAAARPPLKVFILAGQSNMEGHGVIKGRPGQKGTLETLSRDPASAARYKHLLDEDGTWVVRADVWIRFYDHKGNLAVGGFAGRGAIGPELAFGWGVGDYLDERVLLIKFGPGGTSLAGPWRPPSSGAAGEKPRGPGVGDEYDKMIAGVKRQLANLKADFPDYDDKGYEIVGFGWHQGWNDGCSANLVAEYEKNMANFIRDVRKDLGVPKMPFVIAGSGFGGWGQTIGRRLGVMKAQEAVAQYDEFKGNVTYIETRGFFRDGDVSPRPIRYHWCCNAETYYLIGDAMGKAMVELLGGPKAPATPKRPSTER